MKSLKQVILVRTDVKLSSGKLAAQVAHASVAAVLSSDEKVVRAWDRQGMKKVVLKVKDKEELFRFQQLAKDTNLVAEVITDAGRTEIAPGTVTCLGIGPAEEEVIDEITGELSML